MNFDYQEILSVELLDNTIEDYLMFIGISIGVFLLFKIILSILLKKLGTLAKKTKTKLDDLAVDLLKKVQWAAFFLILFITAKSSLNMHATITQLIDIIVIAIITYQAIKVVIFAVNHSTEELIKTKDAKSNKAQISILSKIIKVVVWIVGLMLFLSNIGYDVTSLVAGLGIGSIAVALAVQNILGDVLSSFSIYLDKPFQIGDAIKIGEYRGHVENIGIKTTRIRTLEGEELVVPNNKLTNTELQNYGKLQTRRVLANIGIRYETSCKKVKKAKEIIIGILEKIEKIELNRVHFKEFADSSLIIEIVYTVQSDEYMDYMDINEMVNLKIKEQFEKEGIEFAYPTRTVIMEKA